MPMIEIPYARSEPYDNRDYVARMADLMIRRGELNADAIRRAGDLRASLWTNAGNVAMSTIAQIGAARDEERKRALALQQQAFENAMKQRDYDLRAKELDEAMRSRMQAQQFQQQQYRDSRAATGVSEMTPGDEISADTYTTRYAGTPQDERFDRLAPEAARLPARSVMSGSVVSPDFSTASSDPVLSRAPKVEPRDYVGGVAESVSGDVAARPERYRLRPTFEQQLQRQRAERDEANMIYSRLRDQQDDAWKLRESERSQRNADRAYELDVQQFNATKGQIEPLTEGGLDLAATTLRVTGKMPALGMGKDPDRKRIMNRAAEQAASLEQTPAMVMQAQAAYRADGDALKRMTVARAAAHAFESKALEQSKLVASLSDKVSRTDYPIINGALVAGKVLTGNTNAHLLNNALLTFTTEYAKIMSGSTGSSQGSTDSARREAAELISSALAKGTLRETITQMQREMKWTMDGYNATIANIMDGLGGNTPRWGDDTQGGGGWFDANRPGGKQ